MIVATRTRIDEAGHWLRADAAASYARMRAAGMPAGVTSAGRTRAEQTELRRKWLNGTGAFALPPGNSQHELGLALDLPEPARAWVRKHGAAFGWVKDVNPAEDWHMEYRPALDRHKDDKPKPAPKPAPTPKETDVHVIRRGTTIPKGKVLPYSLITGDRAVTISQPSAAAYKRAGVPVVPLTGAEYDRIVKALVSEK